MLFKIFTTDYCKNAAFVNGGYFSYNPMWFFQKCPAFNLVEKFDIFHKLETPTKFYEGPTFSNPGFCNDI